MSKGIYLNFPVVMLYGFMTDHRYVLSRIIEYAVYYRCMNPLEIFGYLDVSWERRVSEAESYFDVTLRNDINFFDNVNYIPSLYSGGFPMVGISKNMLNDYLENPKTDFEKISLLGFLAIKSIVQNKTYCKVTNRFWMSRMDGKAKSISDNSELSEEIQKYANRWQLSKIKDELILNWGLTHYSRYTRGFYVSFKLPLEDLIYQAEKKRKSTLLKQKKFAEKVALNRVLDKIKNEPP